MKSLLLKTVKILMLMAAITIAVRIAYVNLTSKETETIVGEDEIITYNNLEVRLTDTRAAVIDDKYRVEVELAIENNTDDEQVFESHRIAIYSNAMANGITPCDTGDFSVKVEPGKEVTARYCTDIIKTNVSAESWREIDEKDFKLLLLEYKNNKGWKFNPDECDAEQLSAPYKEPVDDDRYEIILLDEEEFYKTQFVSVGESVNCLWRGISGIPDTFVDMTVEEIGISKEVTEDWQGILDDINNYGIQSYSLIFQLEVADNRITNSYSAVKVRVRMDAETEAIFALDDLYLRFLNDELYPVIPYKEAGYRYYIPFYTLDDDLEFIDYEIPEWSAFITDKYTANIRLKTGVNEFSLVYIVPDSFLDKYDEFYLERMFIGHASEPVDRETHCYSNISALIKCPLR